MPYPVIAVFHDFIDGKKDWQLLKAANPVFG